MEFGALLKQFRRLAGISQKQVAGASGIDTTYLSKIENSQRNPPSRTIIIKIAQTLNLNLINMNRLLLSADFAPIDLPVNNDSENILLTNHLYALIKKKGIKAVYEVINKPMGGAVVIKNNKILVKQINTSPIKGVWAIPHGFVNPKKGDKTAEDIATRLVREIFGHIEIKVIKELTAREEMLEDVDTTDYFMKLGLFPPIFKIYKIKVVGKTKIKTENTLFISFNEIVKLKGNIHPLLYQIIKPFTKDPRLIKLLYDRGQETIKNLTDRRSFYIDMKNYAEKRIKRFI